MRLDNQTYKKLTLICGILAVMLLVFSSLGNSPDWDARRVADRVGRKTERRLDNLDTYARQALLSMADDSVLHQAVLPDDMVIYLYKNDSLVSWRNQFAVLNDDISARLVFQRLSNLKNRILSPLNDVREDLSYMNIGPKWYIVRSQSDSQGHKAIYGLEVLNTLVSDRSQTENGVNPALGLPERYIINPLNNSSGTTVYVGETPLFKVTYDTQQAYSFFSSSIARWLSLLFFALAAVMFLAGHRSVRNYCSVLVILIIILLIALAWGAKMGTSIFSPTLYADGPILYSLGSLLLINAFFTLTNICAFLIRKCVNRIIGKDKKQARVRLAVYGVTMLALTVLTLVYTHFSLKSLIFNSTISMEMHGWNSNVGYTVLAHLSYTGLFFSALLLLQTVRPAAWELVKIRYNIFSRRSLMISAVVWAMYITTLSSVLGFQKEHDRVMVWANRLSVDRDLATEIQLRSIEDAVASDQLIASLAGMKKGTGMIANRVSEYYLGRIRQNYNINAFIVHEDDDSALAHFRYAVNFGNPIADGSRFMFIPESNGKMMYAGVFVFSDEDEKLIHLLLEIEPDSNKEDKGYSTILGKTSRPGTVSLPPNYSYAKYIGDRLVSYKGNYPYPTLLPAAEDGGRYKRGQATRRQGYVHFRRRISDDETIVISRPVKKMMVYFTSFSYLALAVSALLMVFSRGRRKRSFKVNYFRNKINTILFVSSILIMLTMTIISIVFVYKRNEVNMNNLMTTKVNTIQALISDQVRLADDWRDISTQEFGIELEKISNTTKSDISLYTPSGKVFHSTTPEVFEKMILGSRIDEDAFYSICNLHQRFYIKSENIAGHHIWTLYAPLFNDRGDLIAIMSSPYTDKDFDFNRDAKAHAAMIVNLFLLLLIGSLSFSSREVNSLFAPLVVMGKKMTSANIDNLETITYNRNDEISSLVEAYNRMVRDLTDSTRQLAEAERDKAWSQMARQVAHEIKNPLTPIKLELQRLIRLKQNNNPMWEEKFDRVSDVILEHIDILTDTANEFSTFAKLYSEEPTLINLDKVLKEQLMIFDNRENVRISYLGMEEAYVMAPKPQLIRVFVNLITNAIQAVEIKGKECEESGEDFSGKVLVSLRLSSVEGYYDVVVEDNGSGVKDENLGKLFTPNFTTKSGGTGLGLAICRNIIAKCEGEISYKRSFSLGGAAFTVTVPKHC